MRNVSGNIIDDVKTQNVILNNYFFFQKSYRLRDNVEKYSTI